VNDHVPNPPVADHPVVPKSKSGLVNNCVGTIDVGVSVGVDVKVGVGVLVGVNVRVGVGVLVGVGVGVGVASTNLGAK
jgi:hypothetical protein